MKRLFLACGVAALAALVVPAAASTFLVASQEELVEQAAGAIVGKVVAVRSFWNAERTVILSEAVVEVEERLFGESPARVRLRTFGGEVAGYVIEAHGFPTFVKGERILVFLEPESAGAHRVLGYQQGQWRIGKARDGREIAYPAWGSGEATVLKADGTEAPAPRPLPLARLKAQILETADSVGRTDVRPQVR